MSRSVLLAAVYWALLAVPIRLFAQSAWIEPLGPFEVQSPYSYALDVTPDGLTVAGEAYYGTDANRGYTAVLWKDAAPSKIWWNGGRSSANACSANGETVVGYDYSLSSDMSLGWVQTPNLQGGTTLLASSFNIRTQPSACSDDGSVIVGGLISDTSADYEPFEAYRWTQSNGRITGSTRLPRVNNSRPSFAYGCSGDGASVCGTTEWSGGSFPFHWSVGDTQLTKLGSLDTESLYGIALSCSRDKPIWVGVSATDAGRTHAFLCYYGAMYDLETIDGAVGDSVAYGCSDDGVVIVGSVILPGGFPPTACVWVEETGYGLKGLLQAYGVDLTGWSELNNVTDCSSNGRIVVGAGKYQGNTTGFIAKLPPFEEKPVARAGRDQTVQARTARGARVRIDGRASYDPDGGPLTYRWTARNIVFKNDAAGVTSAMFPVGKTKVKLQVTDDTGRKDTDILYVTVRLSNSSVRERGSYADEVFAIAGEEAYRAATSKEIEAAAIAACEYATAATRSGCLAGEVVQWEEGDSLDGVYLDYASSRYSQMLLGVAAAHSLGESLARTGDSATQQALFHTIQAVRHVAADLRTPLCD